MIEPQWGEHYDEEEDKVYGYYWEYCENCGYDEYVDSRDNIITPILQKAALRTRARREYEKLYDRRLGNL